MPGSKKIIITVRPEWEPMLQKLKQEQFKDATQTQMLRTIIELGLASSRGEQPTARRSPQRPTADPNRR